MDNKEPEFMTPGEVASRFRVSSKTVRRWADEGGLRFVRTLGGHRRYYAKEVHALLARGEAENEEGHRVQV